MNKRALILGVTGQDGSYLADLLIEKNYEVHGLYRKSATGNTKNINHLINDPDVLNNKFFLHRGDMLDLSSLHRIIQSVKPHEIYNEADQDHVRWSFDMVGYSSDITGSAVAKLLELVRNFDNSIRVFQPCTSNMYGQNTDAFQNEDTALDPVSPYAIAKTFAYHTCRFYRHTFDMHVSTAILFNHESPRRTEDYVTRKISRSVARIYLGLQEELVLGDLSAEIDWGYAREYMDAAISMVNHSVSDDYVIASGEKHSVKEFVEAAFSCVGLPSEDYVKSSKEFFRPTKTGALVGDYSKANRVLGFSPKTGFADLVNLMVEHDIKNLSQ